MDLCKGRKSPLTGKDVIVVGAGGIADGRGVAMALALGAQAVWVGTRFVASKEASAAPRFQQAIVKAGHSDTVQTLIYSGRPSGYNSSRIVTTRGVLMNYLYPSFLIDSACAPHSLRQQLVRFSLLSFLNSSTNIIVSNRETKRSDDIKKLTASGQVPYYAEMEQMKSSGKEPSPEQMIESAPLISKPFFLGRKRNNMADYVCFSGSSGWKHRRGAARRRDRPKHDEGGRAGDQGNERWSRQALNSVVVT